MISYVMFIHRRIWTFCVHKTVITLSCTPRFVKLPIQVEVLANVCTLVGNKNGEYSKNATI